MKKDNFDLQLHKELVWKYNYKKYKQFKEKYEDKKGQVVFYWGD